MLETTHMSSSLPKASSCAPESSETSCIEDSYGGEIEFVKPGEPLPERKLTPDKIENDLKLVRNMWQMAAILDFLSNFREELKLSVEVGAAELEHVLVCSNGDGGLLASLHVDLMRGISSKTQVTEQNWQVQLANKIRFHWKNLSDGTKCPFKPEKYLEAPTYVELGADKRVEALHFLCCIRCDREDIALRITAAAEEKDAKVIEEAEMIIAEAMEKASRNTRSAKQTKIPQLRALETSDTFRKVPDGEDSKGNIYYIFDLGPQGTRIYMDTPSKATNEDMKSEEFPENEFDSSDIAKMSKKDRERALRRMPLPKPLFYLKSPADCGSWELVASTREEIEDLAETFQSTRNKNERDLGEKLNQISERAAAQEEEARKKQSMVERLRSNLGRSISSEPIIEDIHSRSRRARRVVNYRFDDYDVAIKSAINGRSYNTTHGDSSQPRYEEAFSFQPREDRATRLLKRQRRIEDSARSTMTDVEDPMHVMEDQNQSTC